MKVLNYDKLAWIAKQKLSSNMYAQVTESFLNDTICYDIIAETEKAAKLRFVCDYCDVEFWCTKSCLPEWKEVESCKDLFGYYEFKGVRYFVPEQPDCIDVEVRKIKKNGEPYKNGIYRWRPAFIRNNMTKVVD